MQHRGCGGSVEPKQLSGLKLHNNPQGCVKTPLRAPVADPVPMIRVNGQVLALECDAPVHDDEAAWFPSYWDERALTDEEADGL